MNLQELRKIDEKIEYVRINVQVEKKYGEVITSEGLDKDKLVNLAFREIYDQIVRERAIKGLTPKQPQKEVIEHTKRGEYDLSNQDEKESRLLKVFENKTEWMGFAEIYRSIPTMPRGTVWIVLHRLVKTGKITKNGTLYYLTDDPISTMIPPGTKVNYLQ